MLDREARLLEAIPMLQAVATKRFRTIPDYLCSTEDLVQAALTKLLAIFPLWDQERFTWEKWSYACGLNAMRDEVRRMVRHVHEEMTSWRDPAGDDEISRSDDAGEALAQIFVLRPRLDDRELDVIARLEAGLSQRDIAREFGVAESTVHRWVKGIAGKLRDAA